MSKVSFNQWLSLQTSGDHAPLAAKWKTQRGRLTRASVEARAVELGLPAGAGGTAFDHYLTATS